MQYLGPVTIYMSAVHVVLLTQQDTSQCQKGWQEQVSIYP